MLMAWALAPMHTGHGPAEDANFLQRFNDSEIGVYLGSVLHTTGALFFTAGIIAYLVVARSLRRNSGQPGQWLGVLPYAHWFTIIGIALNGAGGVMRLYQSGHPSITELGSSTWVQVLFLKHMFLLAGVGLALWVTWRTQVPEPEEEPVPKLGISPNRISVFAVASFATIIMATLLGAVASQTVLPADDMDSVMAMGDGDPGAQLVERSLTYGASGSIRGNPVTGAEQRALTFQVVQGTSHVAVDIGWAAMDPSASLGLRVIDEAGEEVRGKSTSLGSSSVLWEASTPIRPGNWTIIVTSESLAETSYDVTARLTVGAAAGDVLEATVTLTPRTSFFEINMRMAFNQTIDYSWDVRQPSGAPVYFDIHTHRGGEVQYHEQGYYDSGSGSWQQEEPNPEEDGISLMWVPENAPNSPHLNNVVVHYRIAGQFELDSVVGP